MRSRVSTDLLKATRRTCHFCSLATNGSIQTMGYCKTRYMFMTKRVDSVLLAQKQHERWYEDTPKHKDRIPPITTSVRWSLTTNKILNWVILSPLPVTVHMNWVKPRKNSTKKTRFYPTSTGINHKKNISTTRWKFHLLPNHLDHYFTTMGNAIRKRKQKAHLEDSRLYHKEPLVPTNITTTTLTYNSETNRTCNTSCPSPPHSNVTTFSDSTNSSQHPSIEQSELMLLLKDEIGWNLFHEFCIKEYSEENVQALTDIQKLQTRIGKMSNKKRRQSCKDLQQKYFSGESQLQVNISGRSKQLIKSVTNSKVIDLETANELLLRLRREVVSNLRDTYSRFVTTEDYNMWKEMVLHPEAIFNE